MISQNKSSKTSIIVQLSQVIILFMLLSSGCKKTEEATLTIPSEYINIFSREKENHLQLVLFFEGNCTSCYGIISAFDNTFSPTQIIAITNSMDTISINYHLKNLNFSGTLVFDTKDHFYQQNSSLLKNNQVFLLKNKKIISKNEFTYDEKVKIKFQTAIKKQKKINDLLITSLF